MESGILITGASGGLGAALAQIYAEPGVRLFLAGRNQARLELVAKACRVKGAEVNAEITDVTDAQAMATWIGAAEQRQQLDLVIANAGISGGTGHPHDTATDQTRRIFAINLDGVLNTVLPVIEPMRSRRCGQIAIMASLAGFRGLPSAPAYSASKAAVRVWGEGLRGWLAKDGVGVSVICPGFVQTPMTDVNDFPMPFLMSRDKAARLIKTGISRNQSRIAFPWPMAMASWCLAALPPALTDRLLARLPGKT